jgi:GntR family transcriptional regulator/MocR family aminotransferase
MRIVLSLDEQGKIPLYRQVIDGIIAMIERGELSPGAKLPSTRELAEDLAISRFTTSKAYDELSRQGYIDTSSSVGSFVSLKRRALDRVAVAPLGPVDDDEVELDALRLSDYGERIMTSCAIEPSAVELFEELNFSAPDSDLLPAAKWHELLVKCSKERDFNVLRKPGDVFGHRALRDSLVDYLARVRGIRCSAEQICIFSGAQSALDLLSCLLINEGDRALVENPGFPGARRLIAAYGGSVEPVPVDSQGLVVEYLAEKRLQGKFIYVTPAHHDPTGAVMSPARREALLAWARRNSVWVLEDDFDSEFRYSEKPLPTLQSQDRDQLVIYLSSFWKIMFPVLSLGFVVLPPRLVAVVRKAKSLAERDFHFIEHEAMAQFISEGHLERHVRRTRATYARRRESLIGHLNQRLPGKVRISPVSAGTHLMVHFEPEFQEDLILSAARQSGLPMVSTGAYYCGSPNERELLIPFAHVAETEIEQAIERFSEAISGR